MPPGAISVISTAPAQVGPPSTSARTADESRYFMMLLPSWSRLAAAAAAALWRPGEASHDAGGRQAVAAQRRQQIFARETPHERRRLHVARHHGDDVVMERMAARPAGSEIIVG